MGDLLRSPIFVVQLYLTPSNNNIRYTMKQKPVRILPSFITPSSPGLKKLKQGGHMPDKAAQVPKVDTERGYILPSFITPASPGLQHLEGGGELGGVEQEGIIGGEGGGGGMGAAAGQAGGSLLAAVGPEIIDSTWDENAHGTNSNRHTAKKFVQRTGEGAALGTQILPGWGTAIGAAVGGAVGIIEGKTGAKKANDAYSKQFEIDYNNAQAEELEPLYARDGGMLYDDGGQLPKLAANGALPGTYNEYNGNPHELGGIKVGPNAEVEDGEVRWGDYVYSDSLQPAKNFTI